MATTGTIEAEILDLERRYWQAMRERDVKTAVSLTEFHCLIAGASGVRSVDQASYEKMMTRASWRIQDVEIEDGAEGCAPRNEPSDFRCVNAKCRTLISAFGIQPLA